MKDEVKARLQLAHARARAAAERTAARTVEARVAVAEIDPHAGFAPSRIIRARKR